MITTTITLPVKKKQANNIKSERIRYKRRCRERIRYKVRCRERTKGNCNVQNRKK